jgi:hypothetical protein
VFHSELATCAVLSDLPLSLSAEPTDGNSREGTNDRARNRQQAAQSRFDGIRIHRAPSVGRGALKAYY